MSIPANEPRLEELDVRVIAGDAIGLATAAVSAQEGGASAAIHLRNHVEAAIRNLRRLGIDHVTPPGADGEGASQLALSLQFRAQLGCRVFEAENRSGDIHDALYSLCAIVRVAEQGEMTSQAVATAIDEAERALLIAKKWGDDTGRQEIYIAGLRERVTANLPAVVGVGEEIRNEPPGWITEILEAVPVDLGTEDTINRRMMNELTTGDESIIDRSQREWAKFLGCSHAAIGKTEAWKAILILRERTKKRLKDKLAT